MTERISAMSMACPSPVASPPQELLLDFLRDRLGLTGAKQSCEVQVCGVCTVLVDGDPVSSCCFLAADIDGRQVETIEGLAGSDFHRRAVEAFMRHAAVQCGFCTSGMLLTAKALAARGIGAATGGRDRRGHERQPVPVHRLPVHPGLARRGPRRIHRGCLMSPVGPGAGAVGQSVERADGRLKLAGQAEFTGDIRLPGMLYGAVLHSPVAHARIVSVDTAEAEKLDGVVAILTGDDLSDLDPYYGHALRDRPIVAIGKVRFVGEPVAVVGAESQAAANTAVTRINVEYDELPVAASLGKALAPDAPLIHEEPARPGSAHGLGKLPDRDGNVCYRYSFRRGDTERAFAEAAVVVEGEYTFPAVYQYSMETHTTIAHWHGGELTLWSSCQHPFLVRQEIAVLFGLPLDLVQVIVPFLGGGFGSKSYTKMEPLTAAIARKAGRPVRILNGVHESMITTRRHNMTCRMRTAAAADGTLLGRTAQAWLDTGAYADNGPRVTATAGDAAPGPYRWQAVEVEAHCVYTNTGPAGSYRAFGATHLQWIAESQVDEVARQLSVDRLEIRRRNLLRPGEEVRPGGKPLDADLVGDIEKAAAAIGWAGGQGGLGGGSPQDRGDPGGSSPRGSSVPPGKRRGRGVSVGLLAAGAHPVSMATVRMGPDGAVTVLVGTTELGQGSRTVMAQIAAEVLHVPPGRVVVRGTDTSTRPTTGPPGPAGPPRWRAWPSSGRRRMSSTRCSRRPPPGWKPRPSCSRR